MTKLIAMMIVEKRDNGYNGSILDWDVPEAVTIGVEVMNRQFHPFPKGTLMYVIAEITPTGRRMVKKVWEKKSPLEETSLLKTRLSPAARIKGWMAADATKLSRAGIITKPVTLTGADIMASVAPVTAPLGVAPASGVYVHTTPAPSITYDAPVVYDTPLMFNPKLKLSPEREALLEQAEIPAPAPSKNGKRSPSEITAGYYLAPEVRLVFTTAFGMSKARPERAVKVMMVGPSGYGKTTMPKLAAEVSGKRFLRMNCATVRDPEEWFGYREAQDGSTIFIRSQFAREIEQGNLVVVLDEFNRIEPWLHNTLFPLLDDDGFTTVHDETFRIGPGVVVVGTINTGHRYTGTFELDEALFNRFDLTLEVGAMPHEEEMKVLVARTGVKEVEAETIVKMCNSLRSIEVVCSTRTSLMIAQLMVGGMDIRQAFEFVVVRRLPQESGGGVRKQVLDLLGSKLSVFEVKAVANDIFSDPAPKRVVKKVVEEVEDDGDNINVHRYTITMERNPTKELLHINILRLLRSMPVVGTSELTMNEAKKYTDALLRSEVVDVFLSSKPDDLSNLLESLAKSGVTGKFTVSKWGAV